MPKNNELALGDSGHLFKSEPSAVKKSCPIPSEDLEKTNAKNRQAYTLYLPQTPCKIWKK